MGNSLKAVVLVPTLPIQIANNSIFTLKAVKGVKQTLENDQKCFSIKLTLLEIVIAQILRPGFVLILLGQKSKLEKRLIIVSAIHLKV